jgi:hypothetical protein
MLAEAEAVITTPIMLMVPALAEPEAAETAVWGVMSRAIMGLPIPEEGAEAEVTGVVQLAAVEMEVQALLF